jgi:hypothetical protein
MDSNVREKIHKLLNAQKAPAFLYKEDTRKLCKNELGTKSGKWFFKQLALKFGVFFTKIHALYIDKEQIAIGKIGDAMLEFL